MRARLFPIDSTPADLNYFFLRHMSVSSLMAMREVSRESKEAVDPFIAKMMGNDMLAMTFLFNANQTRRDIALFLRHYYLENGAQMTALLERAEQKKANLGSYVIFALLGSTKYLSEDCLNQAIDLLVKHKFSPRLIDSMELIRLLVRKRDQRVGLWENLENIDKDVADFIREHTPVYLNLCRASLMGNWNDMDLSYADCRGALFFLNCSNSDLTGVDFRGAIFSNMFTIFNHAKLDHVLSDNDAVANVLKMYRKKSHCTIL